ncbi:MAG: hypothetical protein WDO69_15775 [Pseudomonadota bacterium]
MSDLSSSGRALVQAGRQADRPSDADRERVLAALRGRLGDAAVLATGVAHSPLAPGVAAASRSKLAKWGLLGPTVLVAGAFWFVPRAWQQREKAVPPPSASVVSVQPTPVATVSSTPEIAPSADAVIVGSSRPADTQKVLPSSHDSLAEEVALLSRAETDLHAGRPAKALRVLAEHQRRFPRGALAEERTAARIQALCALGRNDEANAQLTQLLHISPNSAHAARARQACGDPHAAP